MTAEGLLFLNFISQAVFLRSQVKHPRALWPFDLRLKFFPSQSLPLRRFGSHGNQDRVCSMQPVIDFLSLNLFLSCHGLAPSGAEPRPPWNSGGPWGWRRREEEGERGVQASLG